MSEQPVPVRARAVQQRLETFYALEAGPDVTDFVVTGEAGERESVVVHHSGDELEMAVVLPSTLSGPGEELDESLQLVEGVSHFVYLAERARVELPATELELELQAEIDKFVLLAFDGGLLDRGRAFGILRALHHGVRFLHSRETERGRRYRLASELGARLSRRMVERSRGGERQYLQRFYRAGLADKIRLASVA